MNNNRSMLQKTSLFSALTTGFLASSCCLAPPLVAFLGLGSASLWITLEPYRPAFAGITILLLSWVAWQIHHDNKHCLNQSCPPRKPVFLWLCIGISCLLLAAPRFISLFTP